MRDNFQACFDRLMKSEGGYVDHPKDPGGATNLGVTQATLSTWRRQPATKTDVRNLTRVEAAEIYRARYWSAVRGDDLPAGVDYAVFDYAVNSGPGAAIKALQRALGVTADGALGPATLAAARQAQPAALVRAIGRERLGLLQRLTTWATFGKGWGRRCKEVEVAACAMASGKPTSSIA